MIQDKGHGCQEARHSGKEMMLYNGAYCEFECDNGFFSQGWWRVGVIWECGREIDGNRGWWDNISEQIHYAIDRGLSPVDAIRKVHAGFIVAHQGEVSIVMSELHMATRGQKYALAWVGDVTSSMHMQCAGWTWCRQDVKKAMVWQKWQKWW